MTLGSGMKINADAFILSALKEDIYTEDITTNAIFSENTPATANLICKEDGILAGMWVFERVFELLDDTFKIQAKFKDGDKIKKNDIIAVIYGDMRALLTGERTALNYLQRMSGIATLTNSMVKELDNPNIKLLDTRKTIPNMRIFEKYAVKIGNGHNHRYGLSDGILIKDNHISAAGGIKNAVLAVRKNTSFVRKIEVETENLDMVKEALDAGADIIMLDNMDTKTMKTAVKLIDKKALVECSGNVTKERLKELSEIGVDLISSGMLTHSAKALDISIKNLKKI